MPAPVHKSKSGGKGIPPAVQARTERRIQEYVDKHYSGKFTRIEVRFRGLQCYMDAYTEPDLPQGMDPPPGETHEQWMERLRNLPTHLCRIGYLGNEDRRSFAYYTYAHEKYERSVLITGEFEGTPEEAFGTSTQFL
jgi:hypothetical protein